jgi:hypothetical protein
MALGLYLFVTIVLAAAEASLVLRGGRTGDTSVVLAGNESHIGATSTTSLTNFWAAVGDPNSFFSMRNLGSCSLLETLAVPLHLVLVLRPRLRLLSLRPPHLVVLMTSDTPTGRASGRAMNVNSGFKPLVAGREAVSTSRGG